MRELTLPCEPNQIDSFLAQTTPGVLECLRRVPGDIMVVGAGGKMGTTQCLMAKAALHAIGSTTHVRAVSRFTSKQSRKSLDAFIEKHRDEWLR